MKRCLAFAVVFLYAQSAISQEASSAHADSARATHSLITGYVTTSYTFGTRPTDSRIAGRIYDRRHNEFMLNVASLTLEKLTPFRQRGAGFRVEAWLGQNAEVVKSTGFDRGPSADVWQAYVILNLVSTAVGTRLQLKGGKMPTLMGVEVGEDVLNSNLGPGYQDVFLEPFTETGVELDGQFGGRLDAELRLSNGWDQVTDVNDGKTVMLHVGLTPDDRTLVAVVVYTGPEQSGNTHDKRQGTNAVFSRKLTKAMAAQLQLDYGRESGISGNSRTAQWYAAGLWYAWTFDSRTSVGLRADYMNDQNGARTSGVLGFPANNGLAVGGVTATINIKRWDHALLRPEIRYDRAGSHVFSGSKSQLSSGLGLSYIF